MKRIFLLNSINCLTVSGRMSSKTLSIRMLLPFLLILLSSTLTLGSSCCEKKERISTLVDNALDLLSKVKSENISCPEEKEHDSKCNRPLDCADLYKRGYNKSGVYTIWPASRVTYMKGLEVYCDMEDEGWTVIQRRGPYGRADDFFFKDWAKYKKGFGNLETDFWLGNDVIFALTNQKIYSVRFVLEDKQRNKAFAHYDNFWIDDEDHKYTLHISGYRGTAGNAMGSLDNMKFSTRDQDNDMNEKENCGLKYKSGWWFKACFIDSANLNGMYNGNGTTEIGIMWMKWKQTERLYRVEIKIKPSSFVRL